MSGKLRVCYGKSPSLRTVNQLFSWAMFNSKLLVITRGYGWDSTQNTPNNQAKHLQKTGKHLHFIPKCYDVPICSLLTCLGMGKYKIFRVTPDMDD
jgi:hypothetical protein